MSDELCQFHSGVKTDIVNLKLSSENHQKQIEKLDDRIDSIIVRLNVVLTSIIVATIALVANLVIKIV
jgi:hypothetical protein